jgi:hypothetical protein
MNIKDFIVTDNAIDLAMEHLENMEESDLQNLFERMSHEQPHLMGFVVGLGQGLKNNEAEEDLLYLMLIIWHSVELGRNETIVTVTEAEMDQIISSVDDRYNLIMSFSEDEEEDELNSLVGNSSQPAIVGYLADECFSEEYLNLSEDKVAKMFSCLTVLAEHLAVR